MEMAHAVIECALLTVALCLLTGAVPVSKRGSDHLSKYDSSVPNLSEKTNSTLVLSKLLNVSRLQNKEASTAHLRLTKRSAGNGMGTCDFSRNGLNGLSSGVTINKNSFSPFAEEIDDDPHRVPRTITHRWCLCKLCINRARKEDFTLVSVNLTAIVPVYRRNLQGHFVQQAMKVKTGCTCAMPL